MADLQLDFDEGILLQTTDVAWYGSKEVTLDEFILTNKNLFCIYEERSRRFGKPEERIDKISLDSIKVINGKAQIRKIDHPEYEEAIQFLFKNNRREFFSFGEQQEEAEWINTINTIITGAENPIVDEPREKDDLLSSSRKSKDQTWSNANKSMQDKDKNIIEVAMQGFNELSKQLSDTVKTQPKFEQQKPVTTQQIPPLQPGKSMASNNDTLSCSSCGCKLQAETKFCSNCGAANQHIIQYAQNNQRHQEYIGNIKKCPSCGEEITSFTAICPACGHELNSKRVSATLKSFIDQINMYETMITNSKKGGRTGWSSWGKIKKVGWVIFNIYFFCIPLILYLIVPLITINTTPILTKEEKQLATLIENFSFPNDRESILDALVFAKEKIDFISKEKVDRKSAYWMRLWCSKAEQLKQKADLMFTNDQIAESSYKEIQDDENRINNIIKFKAIVGSVLLIAPILFISIRNATSDDIKSANTVLEIPDTELSCLMPKIEGGKGKVVTNNSTYFSVEYYSVSDSGFENYKSMCKEQGFTIDCKNDGTLFDAFNEEGYNIRITHFDSEMDITISDKMKMKNIKWPDSEVANLLPTPESSYGQISSSSDSCLIAYIGNTTIDDYDEYVNRCIESGFDKNMSQTDDDYYADNESGYHVIVEYERGNTIYIEISD
ncbi:MAG: zinc ribbon domain-containing protein [Clostridium sp.]|nr:zinc ribbon domain-containing protein [Clostridium sp.]